MFKVLLTSVFIFFSLLTFGQEMQQNLLSSSGGVFNTASGISVEYSVGELVIATHQGKQDMTCGFQQGTLISVNSSEDVELATFSLYPNPGSGLFYFKSNSAIHNIEIRDLQGRLIHSKAKNIQTSGEIDLTSHSRSVYIAIFFFDNGTKTTIRLCKQ